MKHGASRPKAELHHAYQWDCDNCGTENFVRAVSWEPEDEETEREAKESLGYEPWEEGRFETIPTTVTCKHCHGEFDTIDTEFS